MAPRAGRPTPRMAETPSGHAQRRRPARARASTPSSNASCPGWPSAGVKTIVSIGGGTVAEYWRSPAGWPTRPASPRVEVNLSCPNIEDRGRVFARDGGAAAEVIASVRVHHALRRAGGRQARPRRGRHRRGRPGLRRRRRRRALHDQQPARHGHRHRDACGPRSRPCTGGLSGPAIRPLAVRCVWQVHAALPGVPIIGVGGVMTGRDAFELILAGACAVGVGTALFHDPYACLRIQRELEDLLQARGFQRLADAVGLAHRPPGSARPARAVDSRGELPVTPAPIAVALDAPDLETAARWAAPGDPARQHGQGRPGALPALRPRRDRLGARRERRTGLPRPEAARHPQHRRRRGQAVSRLQPAILTVHAAGGPAMIQAAVEAAPDTQIAAVTVLTSLSEADLGRIGLAGPGLGRRPPSGRPGVGAGARALVCSPHEVAAVRAEVGPDITLITPGVRPAGAGHPGPGPGRHPRAGAGGRRRPPGDRPPDHRRRRPGRRRGDRRRAAPPRGDRLSRRSGVRKITGDRLLRAHPARRTCEANHGGRPVGGRPARRAGDAADRNRTRSVTE